MCKVEVRAEAITRSKTGLSILIKDNEGVTAWLPISQIRMDEVGTIAGAKCVVTMPGWLALDRGLVGEVVRDE